MRNALICIAIALCILGSTKSVDGAIYRCESNGVTTIQDKPCAGVKQEKSGKSSSSVTTDIHTSWFDRPVYLSDKVSCTDTVCQCEGYKRRFADNQNGLRQAVTGIKRAWVGYERQYRKYNSTGKRSSARLLLEKRACEVAVMQAMVRKMYRRNIVKLREELSLGARNEQSTENCAALRDNRSEWVECESRTRLQSHEQNRQDEILQRHRKSFIKTMKILAIPREEYLATARI